MGQLLARVVHIIETQHAGRGEFIEWPSHLLHVECHIIRREAEALILADSKK